MRPLESNKKFAIHVKVAICLWWIWILQENYAYLDAIYASMNDTKTINSPLFYIMTSTLQFYLLYIIFIRNWTQV